MPEWKDYQHTSCCPCHTTRQIAYTVDQAAVRVGCSPEMLRAQNRGSWKDLKLNRNSPGTCSSVGGALSS